MLTQVIRGQNFLCGTTLATDQPFLSNFHVVPKFEYMIDGLDIYIVDVESFVGCLNRTVNISGNLTVTAESSFLCLV